MRVFVAGASGALGTRLVAQLVERGHDVIGTYKTPGHGARIRTLGAESIARPLVPAGRPQGGPRSRADAIVHQATALANVRFLRRFDRSFAATNRLRTEGADALLAAGPACTASSPRASPATATSARVGRSRPRTTRSIQRRWQRCERPMPPCATSTRRSPPPAAPPSATARSTGADDDTLIEPVRRRQFPIVGSGGGVSSFIHLDDAATATVLALEHGALGIYNIVDDEPAPAREWLPVLADALGASPPRRVARWLGRLLAGEAAAMMATEARGASNAKARRELGWTLRHPTWREGFIAAYLIRTRGRSASRARSWVAARARACPLPAGC